MRNSMATSRQSAVVDHDQGDASDITDYAMEVASPDLSVNEGAVDLEDSLAALKLELSFKHQASMDQLHQETQAGVVRLTRIQMRILAELLEAQDNRSYVYALHDATGIPQETVRSAVRSLVQKGVVDDAPPEASESGGFRKPYVLVDVNRARMLVEAEHQRREKESNRIRESLSRIGLKSAS